MATWARRGLKLYPTGFQVVWVSCLSAGTQKFRAVRIKSLLSCLTFLVAIIFFCWIPLFGNAPGNTIAENWIFKTWRCSWVAIGVDGNGIWSNECLRGVLEESSGKNKRLPLKSTPSLLSGLLTGRWKEWMTLAPGPAPFWPRISPILALDRVYSGSRLGRICWGKVSKDVLRESWKCRKSKGGSEVIYSAWSTWSAAAGWACDSDVRRLGLS